MWPVVLVAHLHPLGGDCSIPYESKVHFTEVTLQKWPPARHFKNLLIGHIELLLNFLECRIWRNLILQLFLSIFTWPKNIYKNSFCKAGWATQDILRNSENYRPWLSHRNWHICGCVSSSLWQNPALIHRLSPDSHAPTKVEKYQIIDLLPWRHFSKTVIAIVKSFELQSEDGEVQTGSIFSHSPVRPPPVRGSWDCRASRVWETAFKDELVT